MDEPTRPSRFLRQYALTQGRVRSIGRDLPLDTLVQATSSGVDHRKFLTAEQAEVIDLTEGPISIAEIGAHLGVHLGITRVLVSDMCANEYVLVSTSDFAEGEGPDVATLERLLDDLSNF